MARDQGAPAVITFFKIICDWNLRDEKIRLPNKFTRKCGELLSNPVLLKVADGTEWKVHWNRIDGVIWFDKGWKEFVQHYSLAHGYLLLFKYVLASHFGVQICDMSTLEIDYPHHETNSKPHEDVKAEDVPDEGATLGNENKTNADEPPGQQVKEDSGKSVSRRGRPPKPKTKLSFEVQMQPSYIKGRCIAIPSKIARKYLKEGVVLLKVGGRTWRVRFKIWRGDGVLKYKLQKGWCKFRRENNLEVGDVCVFELTNATKATFNVLISRAAAGGKPSCSYSLY